MGPKDIVQMIEKEIGDDWSFSNAHQCNLRKCLVRPKRRKSVPFDGAARDMYVVLEENPETHEGCNVIFDDASGRFGLGQLTNSHNFVLGFHDSFFGSVQSDVVNISSVGAS